MINIVVWILFGALCGWIISLLISTSREKTMRFIIIGILGALIGGALNNLIKGESLTRFSDIGIFIAVVCSLLLIGLIGALRKVSF